MGVGAAIDQRTYVKFEPLSESRRGDELDLLCRGGVVHRLGAWPRQGDTSYQNIVGDRLRLVGDNSFTFSHCTIRGGDYLQRRRGYILVSDPCALGGGKPGRPLYPLVSRRWVAIRQCCEDVGEEGRSLLVKSLHFTDFIRMDPFHRRPANHFLWLIP